MGEAPSLRVEQSDIDVELAPFGAVATVPASPLVFGTDRIRQDVDLFTVRVSYHFGGGK
jgi:hypothetical protein